MCETEIGITTVVISHESSKVTYHTYFSANMVNNSFNQKYILLGENASMRCSRITVVNCCLKFTHMNANGIKPGINVKMTDKHTAVNFKNYMFLHKLI